ncbi:Metallo-dependent phosphatase-like protein [Pilobolus umbonatus]|nr:Metallo-dependent phosphatase-like protein [Pilobolus umbonatus]
MAHYYQDNGSSNVVFVEALPLKKKTAREKRMWKLISLAVCVGVIVVVVIGVAVVLTKNKKSSSSSSGEYPVSPYAHMTKLVTNNDPALLNKERVFVVGDVHGCLLELETLLNTIKFNPEKDQLILAGDLVAKGPSSVPVIRKAIEMGALCVRGNHDDKTVRLKTFELERGANALLPLSATLPEDGVPDPIKFKTEHTAIALAMSQSDYDYLAACPVILNIPAIDNTVIVHAGLDPTIPTLEGQIPYLVMNMRDIDSNDKPSVDRGIGVEWGAKWNAFQASTASTVMNVFYGHDSGRGLNIKAHTFGLDSGCVYGGQLTAIELRTRQLTEVKCRVYADKNA